VRAEAARAGALHPGEVDEAVKIFEDGAEERTTRLRPYVGSLHGRNIRRAPRMDSSKDLRQFCRQLRVEARQAVVPAPALVAAMLEDAGIEPAKSSTCSTPGAEPALRPLVAPMCAA